MALKGEGTGPLPPLLEQYVELIEAHPDYLVLFQVGDFYETFGEHAETLARRLDLALTRKTSKDFVTPMAGVPVRSADGYIERLLAQGVRVAIADQVEPAGRAEGLVRREVVQLVTPGTVVDERLLGADATWLAAVATGDGYGLALLDVATGELRGAMLRTRSALFEELGRYRPAEALLAPELAARDAFRESFARRFPALLATEGFDPDAARERVEAVLGELPPALAGAGDAALLRAVGAALDYAAGTQGGALPQVRRFERYDPGASMRLDEATLATLEVFATSMGTGRSLVAEIDGTRTAPGRRLLRAWLRHPLLEPAPIRHRQDAVEALLRDGPLRERVRRALHRVHDLERLAARLAAGRAGPRDLAALARSARLAPELLAPLADRPEAALAGLAARAGALGGIGEEIDAALVDDPPAKLGEGGLLRDGVDRELDALRRAADDGRAWIAALEAREREATGIPTLKVGFHGVFGYHLEVTRPWFERVPPEWRPVQTLKDRQRYTRADLRDKEGEVLRAEEAARLRELEVFDALRASLAPRAQEVRDVGAALAELDVYAALADLAARRGYRRPEILDDADGPRRMEIRGGRHPVVEAGGRFIPNDTELAEDARLVVLTGPNMSGKSTWLRQNGLIALLAQIGSFVPADAARLPTFDRVFTRIGAHDDIAGGRSTFLVEMSELAAILRGAGPRSLVLLDEVGRGTGTSDGLAIAWAAAEHLHDEVRAFCLLATHYAELTALADRLPAARNRHVAAREEGGGLVFYHQVRPGPARSSYGLEVARIAGVPAPVLARARRVFEGLEAERAGGARGIVDELLAVDPARTTPLEALALLQRLQARARGLDAATAGGGDGGAGEPGSGSADERGERAPGPPAAAPGGGPR